MPARAFVVFRGGLVEGERVEVVGLFDAQDESHAIQAAAEKRKAGGSYSAFPIGRDSLANVTKNSRPTFSVERVAADEQVPA